MDHRPRLLITLGDVAGIGPEVVAKAWVDLLDICGPVVVGDVDWLRRATKFAPQRLDVVSINEVNRTPYAPHIIPCLQATTTNLAGVETGAVHALAGRAAYDFLCAAIDATRAGQADGIVTMPLNKEGLHAAGLFYPGHTEILAERTGVKDFGMML